MRKGWTGVLVLLVLSGSTPSGAQESKKSDSNQGSTIGAFGVRGGFGLDPDQFVIGAQAALGKKLGVARVVPSVDVGLGSSITTISFNGDLHVRLNMEDTEFGLYLGAGPSVVYADIEAGSSGWDVGLTLLAGAHIPLRALPFNVETRFGVGDVPDFRGLIVLEF